MLNEVIQAIQMVFMNFWYIEHYGAIFGVMLKGTNSMVFMNFWYIE